MMRAILLNLIQTGEILSCTYANRAFALERTAYKTGYFSEATWADVSIITCWR